MYGVPAHLNLSAFHGATLDQIALGAFDLQFHFSGAAHPHIGVEGHWELRGPDGVVLDQQMENAERTAYRLHVLLGRTVTASDVDPPRSFALTFDNGHVLRVFDDSPEYESFSIQPGDVFV